MTKKYRVSSSSTHSKNAVKVETSEFGVINHQRDMMLIDPEDYTSGNTHSQKKPVAPGDKKLSASIVDEERAKGGRIAQIDNQVDPAAGYLEQETGLPVINNAATDDELNSEFEDLADMSNIGAGVDDDEDDEFEDNEVDAEFEDESDADDVEDEDEEELSAEFDEMEMLDGPNVEADADDEEDGESEDEAPVETLSFEEDQGDDAVSLVDADCVEDTDTDDVAFATVANVVHVVRANRIIASMGPASARKAGMSDVYLTNQFQDVVQASMDSKGLRKGLVQSGFVLAKVKVSASKVVAKVVKTRVEAMTRSRVEAMAKQDKAMEQALAIAAVGVNRAFFKGAKNELSASLESEFSRMGVRGAGRIVRAMFAQHGIGYAQEILTLAKRISAMPEEVRDEYASALDLTNDDDFDAYSDEEITSEFEDADEEEYSDSATSVTAALVNPVRRVPALLKAGVSHQAMDILSGNGTLL